jgi:hypothetical protein
MNRMQRDLPLFIARSSPELPTTFMSMRHAHVLLAVVLSLIAMDAAAAWAKGNRGDRSQHARQQVAYRSDRNDLPPRNDRPVHHADAPVRNDRQPLNNQPLNNDYPARANDPHTRYEPRNGDLQSSVRRVQRETGGQVLRAQPIVRDGREMYRVKVLTPEGRIRVYEDDSSFQRRGYRDPSTPPRRPPG